MAQMATLARDEEAWWSAEIARIAPQLILPGRPVRGGGRTSSEGLALDITRLADLAPAQQRRLLRHASRQLGAAPDFVAIESLRSLALTGRAGQKLQLADGLHAERTHRELRLTAGAISPTASNSTKVAAEYSVAIPGEIAAPAFGILLRIDIPDAFAQTTTPPSTARLRPWKPGDRVRLRHSSSPRKVKEVLERMKVTGSDRVSWPVLECGGQIVWMRGVEVEADPGLHISATPFSSGSNPDSRP
jgi:tRNA(Ile)-lysidine synthase